MRKIIVIILFCSVVSFGFAEKSRGVRIDAGVGLAASVYSNYLYINPEVLYDFGFIAVGGGVNTIFGLTYSDVYMAPYGEVEIGWFYFDLGMCINVNEPDPEKSDTGYLIPSKDESAILPYVSTGLAAPLIPIGPGKLGLDLSMSFFPSASPIELVDSEENILADIIGTIFVSLIGGSLNTVKAGASLCYTITL